MTRGAIRPRIEKEGQRYIDQPVEVLVSKANKLALAVNYACKSMGPLQRDAGLRIEPAIQSFSHWQRAQLKWVHPKGNQP